MSGNDANTTVLLHFDGSNGGTTITDSNIGGSAHTWTANSATTSTTQTKFGTASLSVGSSVGWVDTADSTDFTLGSGAFTIDCWFYVSGGSGTTRIMFGQSNSGASLFSYGARLSTANVLNVQITPDGSTQTNITGTTTYTAVGWHHFALVRTGNILRMFGDGVQDGGDVAFSSTVYDSANKFAVGRFGEIPTGTLGSWNGFIDEFRLSVGVARWTTTFTPPTAAYSADYTASITEAASATTAQDAGTLFVDSITEAATAADSTNRTFTTTASITEAGSASSVSAAAATYSATVLEAATAGDRVLSDLRPQFQNIRNKKFVLQKLRVTQPILED